MIDEIEARKIVEPILRRALEPYGLAELEVVSSVGHYGDPILLAIAKYRADAPKLPVKAQLDAVVGAMSDLSRSGDDRFLHVRNVFADGEPAVDDFPPPPKPKHKAMGKG
jgi:RNA binding exosome subunit